VDRDKWVQSFDVRGSFLFMAVGPLGVAVIIRVVPGLCGLDQSRIDDAVLLARF